MAEKQGGYYYCSRCNREYLHPWDKDRHEGHKTYETGQAKRFALKLHLMSEATRLLQIAKYDSKEVNIREAEATAISKIQSNLLAL